MVLMAQLLSVDPGISPQTIQPRAQPHYTAVSTPEASVDTDWGFSAAERDPMAPLGSTQRSEIRRLRS
jgi:hypothetical protein